MVDDQPESRESASALLAAEGYEVSGFSDGEEAIRSLETRRPSAILYRILEPANAVIGFVRRMALSRYVLSVPVVVVTALNEFQVGSFLNGVPGVRRIVYSPCEPEALLGAISRAMQFEVRR